MSRRKKVTEVGYEVLGQRWAGILDRVAGGGLMVRAAFEERVESEGEREREG